MFKYRPEIDGLRCLAVLPVLLFHAHLPGFSGGFVGVDVFFVISGYLITNILQSDIRQGNFSILKFYERRARRILPALFLVCTACIPFAWLWMLPEELKDFSQSLLAVNLFSSNILFWRESGYFDVSSEMKPLLHTWSLAIEEQFYIFFPLVLWVANRLRQRYLLIVLLSLTIGSFVIAEFGSRIAPSATFYLLPSRAWELGVGAVMAIALGERSFARGAMAQVASVASISAIVFAIVAYDENYRYPGVWSLFPVVGTAAVIAFAGPSTFVGWFLSLRPVVFGGLISYSAYLWHQPLFAFARIRTGDLIGDIGYWVLVALSLSLAVVSWRFVEIPFRNRRKFDRRQIFAGSLVIGLSLGSLAVLGVFFPEISNFGSPDAVAMDNWSRDISPYRETCHSKVQPAETACVLGGGPGSPIAVWADSHGVELAWKIAENRDVFRSPVRQFTLSACPPTLGLNVNNNRANCAEQNQEIFEFLRSNDEIEVVILMARWALYMSGQGFDNFEGGKESVAMMVGIPTDAGSRDGGRSDREAQVGKLYGRTVRMLLDIGKRVVLVYPQPAAGWNVPRKLARELKFGWGREGPLSIAYRSFRDYTSSARRALDVIPSSPDLLRVWPEELFCEKNLPGRCVSEWDGKPLYFDDDHFNSVGAALIAGQIGRAIRERGWLR